MENVYPNNSWKVTKHKALNCDVSPINVQKENQQFFLSPGCYYSLPHSPLLDTYTVLDGANLDSTVIKYLTSGSPVANSSHGYKTPAQDSPKYRQMIGYQFHNSNTNTSGTDSYEMRGLSRSPLSSIENLLTPPSRSQSLFQTPVKVEEDVLVMDAIQVGSASGARGRSASSSDSGSSSSSGNKSCFRTDICQLWEDSGRCGSKCQFGHGVEELRPTRYPYKTESEICKLYTSGSSKKGSKSRFGHHRVTPSAPLTESPPTLLTTATSTNCVISDWFPQYDSIDIALPFSASTNKVPSHEELDAYMHSIFYSPPRGKRLAVFTDICPE